MNRFDQPVYKFMKQEHVESFLKDETLRIGTLAEYRLSDGHSAARSDEREATRTWRPDVYEVTQDHPMAAQFADGLAAGLRIAFEDPARTTMNFHLNGYAFCVSGHVDPDLVARMAEPPWECTACLLIHDFPAFARHLARATQLRGAHTVAFVSYRERVDVIGADSRPQPFVKPTDYAWQDEATALWIGDMEGPQSGFVGHFPRIAKFAEVFDLTKNA